MATSVIEQSRPVNEAVRVRLPRMLVLLWVWSAALLALTVVVGWNEWRLGWPIQEHNPLGNPRHEDLPGFASFTVFTYPNRFLYGGLIQALLLMGLFVCVLEFPFVMQGEAAEA